MSSLSPATQALFDSLMEESLSFFKGDNNAPWAILAETAMGCVPILGQVVDARDIVKGLVEISDEPNSELAWFNMITALIGLVPGGGDAAKRSMRAIKSGAMNRDDLLAMIRRFYSGDPEQLLRKVMDPAVLEKKLAQVFDNPHLLKMLSEDMRWRIVAIRREFKGHLSRFEKEINDWLAHGRMTSAEAPMRPHQKHGAPAHKPNSKFKEGKHARLDSSNDAYPNRANSATLRTARFKQVTQKLLGVLGEHMADYYCQDVKGWGEEQARHDHSQKNLAKLNDGHQLVQLWPCIPRGRGIDAVWKTNSGKPYAIIEAKASFNPAKTLGQLLGEAGDKNANDAGESLSDSGKGGGLGRKKAKAKQERRQRNGRVTQMSTAWIEKRLTNAVRSRTQGEIIINQGYSRHVLLFSVPHAAAHAEALLTHSAGKWVDSSMHAEHQITNEWQDNQIQKVVNNRAGLNAQQRNKKGS
ncbi:MAG: hypothetical protein ACOH2R_02925 [Pseudomonas sp.]